MTEPILEDPTATERGTMTAPVYVSESSTQTHYTPALTSKEAFLVSGIGSIELGANHGRAEEFDLDRDGRGNLSIKVSDDLIGYGGLRRGVEHAVVVVGLIWWAEVYDADVFAQSKISSADIKALAQSLA